MNENKHAPLITKNCSIFISTIVFVILFTACSSPNCYYNYNQMFREFNYSNQEVYRSRTEEYDFNGLLERSSLIEAVIALNPSLEAVRQAWGAMLAKYPQATALDDPVASYELAPGSINSNKVNFGESFVLSQKIPFPGKLRLRGRIALAAAGSAEEDYEWAKIQLATIASILFDDYYVVERAIEINEIHINLLKEFKESANAQYASSQVNAQVPLQADVELARLEYEQISLTTDREVILAKINALLHRQPSASLPPSPKMLIPILTKIGEKENQLQQAALENRPDLRALHAQIDAAESAIRLNYLGYFPDFEPKGGYNTMWGDPQMRTTVGIGINIPIQLGRRKGAVDESKANLKALHNRRLQLEDLTLVEVTTTLKKIAQAQKLVQILQEKIIPTAQDQLEVATAGFESGQVIFLVLIESEKTLRSLELELQTAIAELYNQLSTLDQVVGLILHFSQGEELHE